jgi:hypothetical protein
MLWRAGGNVSALALGRLALPAAATAALSIFERGVTGGSGSGGSGSTPRGRLLAPAAPPPFVRLMHCTRPRGAGSGASAAPTAAGTAQQAPASTVAAQAAPAPAPAAAGGVGGEDALYSLRQLSKHASEESCWIAVDGEVRGGDAPHARMNAACSYTPMRPCKPYTHTLAFTTTRRMQPTSPACTLAWPPNQPLQVFDVTSYLDDHPGGAESILLNAGVDCSDEFNPIHSSEAKALLKKYRIGALAGAQPKPAAAAAATAAAPAVSVESVLAEVREVFPPPPPPAASPAAASPTVVLSPAAAEEAAALAAAPVTLIDPRARYDLPLESTQRLNHDTYLMQFALPSAAHRVGLPCGKHVFLFAGAVWRRGSCCCPSEFLPLVLLFRPGGATHLLQ